MAVGLPILPLLILLFILALSGSAIYFIFRTKKRPDTSVCGACSYSVDGLTTFTCPECGSDLRKVGILTPNQSRPLPGWLKCIFFTIALPLPALILSAIIIAFAGPTVNQRNTTWTISQPASASFTTAYVETSARSTNWAQGFHTAAALSAPSESTIRIWFERNDASTTPASQFDILARKSKAQSAFTPADLAPLVQQAGLDAANPAVQAELAVLADFMTQAGIDQNPSPSLAPGAFGFGPSTSISSFSGPAPWFAILMAALWFIIWVLGCLRLLRAPR